MQAEEKKQDSHEAAAMLHKGPEF
jgi:hypothetical protein